MVIAKHKTPQDEWTEFGPVLAEPEPEAEAEPELKPRPEPELLPKPRPARPLMQEITETPELMLLERERAAEREIGLTQLLAKREYLSSIIKGLYSDKPDATIDDIAEWANTKPDDFLSDLLARNMPDDAEMLLRGFGATTEDIDAIFGAQGRQKQVQDLIAKVIPQHNLESLSQLLEQNPDQFVAQIKVGGWTEGKAALLRVIGLDEAGINEIIKPWWTLDYWKESFVQPYAGKDFTGQLLASFVAGIGDLVSGAGSIARRYGYDKAGATLSIIGSGLQNLSPPMLTPKYDLSDISNPDAYAVAAIKLTRMLPFSLSLVPVGIAAYMGGGAIAGALGLGRIGTFLLGGLASKALTAPAESAIEAGGAYDEALAQGKSKKEAETAFNETFRNNALLLGLTDWEIALALAPTPGWVPKALVTNGLARVARVSGKTIILGLTEGGQEVSQNVITRHALGEDWKISPLDREAFVLGSVMGLGGGLGGDLVTGAVERARGELSGSLKRQFDKAALEFRKQGFSAKEIDLRALDQVARMPEGETVIGNALREFIESERGGAGKGIRPSEEWPKMTVPERVRMAKDAGLEGTVGNKDWADLTQGERRALAEPRNWDMMAAHQRAGIAEDAGLERKVGVKAWTDLTMEERQALSKQILTPEKIMPVEKRKLKYIADAVFFERDSFGNLIETRRTITSNTKADIEKTARNLAKQEDKRFSHLVYKEYPAAEAVPKAEVTIPRPARPVTEAEKPALVEYYRKQASKWRELADKETYKEPSKEGERRYVYAIQQAEALEKAASEVTKPPTEAIPKAEPGMPEAGWQPSMLPEEVAAKEVRPGELGIEEEVVEPELLSTPPETTLPMPDNVNVSEDRVVRPPPPPEIPPPPEPPATPAPQPAPIEAGRITMPDLQPAQQVVDIYSRPDLW